jgi:hypothetical protein
MSCVEDEEKVIQTDLPTEAAELFSIADDWNESLYFAMISWERYLQLDTTGLPGCPTILIDEKTKKVTLDFLPSTTCIQTGKYKRSGQLIIKFDTIAVSPLKKWTMEYDNYFFETNSLSGIRKFSSTNEINVLEEFTDIIERTEKDLKSEFSGTLQHTKGWVADTLSSFTSSGKISGINAAGRDFELTTASEFLYSVSCFQQNEILPKMGKANWLVCRGINSSVTYSVTYESLIEDCKVAVNAILPDGKKLLLNQSN